MQCPAVFSAGQVAGTAMNIVRLPKDLLTVNAAIQGQSLRSSVRTVPMTGYSGTVHNGYNEVIAQVAPGISGKVHLTFKMAFPSVTASEFLHFRKDLQSVLGTLAEKIAAAAGIVKAPPPESTFMAAYASQLFSDVFFNGQNISQADWNFPAPDSETGQPYKTLALVREQQVKTIRMSGTLKVKSKLKGKTAKFYVPITAITFSDGLVIPFAGYSQAGLLAANGQYETVQIPERVWQL